MNRKESIKYCVDGVCLHYYKKDIFFYFNYIKIILIQEVSVIVGDSLMNIFYYYYWGENDSSEFCSKRLLYSVKNAKIKKVNIEI